MPFRDTRDGSKKPVQSEMRRSGIYVSQALCCGQGVSQERLGWDIFECSCAICDWLIPTWSQSAQQPPLSLSPKRCSESSDSAFFSSQPPQISFPSMVKGQQTPVVPEEEHQLSRHSELQRTWLLHTTGKYAASSTWNNARFSDWGAAGV